MTYASDRLFEEVAYVAYYLHWPFDAILDLEHPVREKIIEEIGKINGLLSGDDANDGWVTASAFAASGMNGIG